MKPKTETRSLRRPGSISEILTIVFRHGAQHHQGRSARAKSLLNDEQKKSGNALTLKQALPTRPHELLRDPASGMRQSGCDFSSGQRMAQANASSASPRMNIAARTSPHHAARIPPRSVLIATLRGARVATTGRELGDSAGARPEIGARKDRSSFCRGVNDIAIKNACRRPNRPYETCADKAPRRSHDFDAAGRGSRPSFLN